MDTARLKSNWREGRCKREFIQCGGNGIYCLQYDEEKIISGSRDNTLKLWHKSGASDSAVAGPAVPVSDPQYKLGATLEGHTGSVLCLQFDNKKVVSGSSDSTIRIWDVETGTCINTLDHAHEQSVLHLRFIANRLVSCSKDKSVRVWNISDDGTECTLSQVLEGHKAAVNVVEFDEKYIVSASGDRAFESDMIVVPWLPFTQLSAYTHFDTFDVACL